MRQYPAPSFNHLIRLSDDTGVLEHARGATPRRGYGYCVDDVARALLVACREPQPTPEVVRLIDICLAFLLHAQADDGSFHNRLNYSRAWIDEPGIGDWWGRAIWGLGTAVGRAPAEHLSDSALVVLERAAHNRSRWSRSMAFAGLGAAEVLRVIPEHKAARQLLADAVATIGPAADRGEWPWPEPRLTYANAALAEVHLAAGEHLGDERALRSGLRMLGWLLELETYEGHLSPTPVGGWSAGDARPSFDQQPIEAAAMADACARAFAITGEVVWADGLRRSIDWFLGDNDAKTDLADWQTGGCADGLSRSGRSDNEGAESTLALLSTLQLARNLSGPQHA
jgi:hypothetical protein